MAKAPIGVFDSGIGGLSVLKDIRTLLPCESLYYIADSAYVPYGEKTPEQIRERCFVLADFLIAKGVKALVIACNTATAAAIAELRERYPYLPIIGMEPAVKPAALVSKSKTIGVLATTGTLKSAKFAALLDRFALDVRVITQPCPGLVECIEQGDLESQRLQGMLQGWVEPLLAEGCDTLILGCTHYPFIKPALASLIPESVTIIDTGKAVAKRLAQLLAEQELKALGNDVELRFWATANAPQMQKVLPLLLGQSHSVTSLFDN